MVKRKLIVPFIFSPPYPVTAGCAFYRSIHDSTHRRVALGRSRITMAEMERWRSCCPRVPLCFLQGHAWKILHAENCKSLYILCIRSPPSSLLPVTAPGRQPNTRSAHSLVHSFILQIFIEHQLRASDKAVRESPCFPAGQLL